MESLYFLGGCILGFVVVCLIMARWIVGDLRIDRSDTYDGPYLFLELNKGIDNFSHQKYVLLKVKNENFPRK